ncbi:CUB and zona pellucida-like domain-containing protein 1 isoform X2 [Lampetra planeri]
MKLHHVQLVQAGVTYVVECVNERMSATIAKSVLLGYGASDLVMNSATPACRLTETGPYIRFNISLGEYGTVFEETSTDIVFSQTISLPSTTFGIITYDFVYILVNAICKIPRTELLSSLALQPNSTKVVLNQTVYADLELKMDFYKSSTFLAPYLPTDYPLAVQLRQTLYLQLSLKTGLDLSLFTVDLYATPTNNHLDPRKYYLVKEGHLRDSTERHRHRRFTFPAFAFTSQDTNYVYIHAALIACKASLTASRCHQGCLARKRRSSLETVDTLVYIFTRGPFVYSEDAALSCSEILNYPGVGWPLQRLLPSSSWAWALLRRGCWLSSDADV